MTQKRSSPPPVMTWTRASPIMVTAGIFDLLRMFFEQFWFFGPALAAAYCTSVVNDVVGTSIADTAGKLVALGCGTVSGAAGYFGSPVFIALGVIMAIAVGLLGWMTIGLILVMINARIFKENESNAVWFAASLLISETPIIGTIPGLTGILWKMYREQIKRDKENIKKYLAEQAALDMQEQQQAAYLQTRIMQARTAQQATTEIY